MCNENILVGSYKTYFFLLILLVIDRLLQIPIGQRHVHAVRVIPLVSPAPVALA